MYKISLLFTEKFCSFLLFHAIFTVLWCCIVIPCGTGQTIMIHRQTIYKYINVCLVRAFTLSLLATHS